MLTIRYQTAFKKDYKRIVRRGYDVRLLEEVITILAEQKPLPEIYRDHNLSGDYIGCRECHITPDWLLIYERKRQHCAHARLGGMRLPLKSGGEPTGPACWYISTPGSGYLSDWPFRKV